MNECPYPDQVFAMVSNFGFWIFTYIISDRCRILAFWVSFISCTQPCL